MKRASDGGISDMAARGQMTEGHDIPPGMVPVTGSFRFESAELGAHDLTLSHGQFTVFAQWGAEAEPVQLSLTVMLAARVVYVPAPDPQDRDRRIAPSVSFEPQFTDATFLRGRNAGALDGFVMRYRDEDHDWPDRPGSLYQDGYGGLMAADMTLVWRDGGYDLKAQGVDEFDRRFEVEARLPAFAIVLRGEGGARDDVRPERWLERQFDPGLTRAEWQHCGPADGDWYDLMAEFHGGRA